MTRSRGEQFREAFDAGYQACLEEVPSQQNPYGNDWRMAREWHLGWSACQETAARGASTGAAATAAPRGLDRDIGGDGREQAAPRMMVRVNVAPAELDACVRFYEALQSLQAVPVPAALHHGGRMFAVGSFLVVEQATRGARAALRPVATLLVSNVHAYYRSLIKAGSRIVLPLRESRGGGAFSAENPDGLVVEYLEVGADLGRPERRR
jgi:hypothetical protein